MNKTLKIIAFMSMLLAVGCSQTQTTSGEIPPTTNPVTSSVTNSNAPILTVKNDITINIKEKVHYLNLVSATDEVDGNISHLISVELPSGVSMDGGYLSFISAGTYTINFSVNNSRNINAKASIKITVISIAEKDGHKPTIIGYKENIRVKPNVMAYPLEGVTAIDDVDGDVTATLKATYKVLSDATDGISFEEEGNYKVTITANDKSGNEQAVEINIEVNSADVPTYVDITDNVTKEYNCSVEKTDEMPYPNSNSRMIVLSPSSTGDSKKYANFKLQFDNDTDLKDKMIEFDVKPGANLYSNKMSFSLRNNDEAITSQIEVPFQEKEGTGYSFTALDNGWYHVTIVFSKMWSTSSYVTDYVRMVFSNTDYAKAAYLYIANVLYDDYKPGDDIGGGNEGGDTGDTGGDTGGDIGGNDTENLYDYSDVLQNNYNATVTFDTEVSHDGVQSAKFVGNGVSSSADTAGAQAHIGELLAGKKLSFYVKFDGETCRKNRIALTIYSDSTTKLGAHNISFLDSLPNGITLNGADENGWHYVELDMDTLGYNSVEIYKVRFVIQSPDGGVTFPTCWIDEINVKG